ncbi:MAG: hypothetical protein M3Z07_02450 [Candidatus Eremiobacteraeota bacterium]|nr:hypothetical protein [Candidatus Eremiobacteraeota bacterium]
MAGWVRPLLRALYARDEEADVHLFFVPDEYATGAEADVARETFPAASVYDPKDYLKVALGARVPGLPARFDAVLYLGGDLMHASRLHKRLGGVAATYKFSRPRYARTFARAYAVDEANARQLLEWKTETARIRVVGNLAIDGALLESRSPREAGYPQDGVLFMPGSRRYEIEHLIPFFFTSALRMRAENASLPIAFGLSPFTALQAVSRAIEAGGHPRVWAEKGTLLQEGDRTFLASPDGKHRFPVVRHALAAATAARLVVTIPGTKAIELAALGKPAIAITPLNAPEEITINGPLTYLDRLPLMGRTLKRAAVVAVARRHRFHTQPNIDAGEELIYEMHGTLTPGRVARVALEKFADASWLARVSQALAALYKEHVGAADRMAADLIAISESGQ